MGKPKAVLGITVKEARICLKGISDLDYSDAGAFLCDKLEAFIKANSKRKDPAKHYKKLDVIFKDVQSNKDNAS